MAQTHPIEIVDVMQTEEFGLLGRTVSYRWYWLEKIENDGKATWLALTHVSEVI